ncbi:MAG TPA: pyruvate kinase [Candidatus Saccharimonadales bacterium]|nr:pyruvate kinase [Candidatus Saccharimonadales bacterium]
MKATTEVPNVSIADFKRTKIIATVGPSTDSYELVRDLIEQGANGLRLNFSHGTHDEHGQRIKWIRKASKELGKPVAIIQDLQGPKVRLGDFDGVVNVTTGQPLQFYYSTKAVGEIKAGDPIPTQYDLSKKVKRGERLYLFDGKVRTTITSVKDGVVHARAENDGILIKRKGMNLPDTDFAGDIITKKDKEDIAYGSTQDIDYVALSFVQSAQDISDLHIRLRNLNSDARIIAKIETKAAVDNLESIMEITDAVMIARGDLAVETPPESVPIVQRKIIGLGLRYSKPTIVATQMLASMTDMPEPTRAEVSDVATAVLLGADCVMLSDETASGKYPIEAVKFMKRVIRYSEGNAPLKVAYPDYDDHGRQGAISRAIISLAESIRATAIVAETKSGATALQISSRRISVPIIAVTSDQRTRQQLALVNGVKSYLRPVSAHAAEKLTKWLQDNKVLHKGDIIVTVSGQYPGVVGTTDTIKVRVLE